MNKIRKTCHQNKQTHKKIHGERKISISSAAKLIALDFASVVDSTVGFDDISGVDAMFVGTVVAGVAFIVVTWFSNFW